ncbi:MAG: diguanylate cyclase [Lachnospiraceae bacterium]|nr:diguanylate cyclase [Lachnospiraceae bacterium]
MAEVTTFEALKKELEECKTQLHETKQRLDALMDNIPGGVFSYDADTLKFIDISESVLNIFHCSRDQFREKYYNSFELMIMKADRAKTREMLFNQMEFFDNVELTYRVLDMMDNVMWIYHRGRLITEQDGRKVFFVVISDITEEKMVQAKMQQINEKLYIETERFKLIEEATDNTEYDYDVKSDVFESSKPDVDGNRTVIRDFLKNRVMYHRMHPDDYPIVNERMVKSLKEPKKGIVEYRLFDDEGNYTWYRLNYASFADKNGRVMRVVGSAKDITEEKKKQQELKEQVERDPMTGLLNKVAMQNTVEEYLKTCDIGSFHALIMIDTDHFKDVNDKLGHLYGDDVIKMVADSIRSTFRETDYIGRVGGDEFMVFMKHTTPVITENRAELLNRNINQDCSDGTETVHISCSIGIAYYSRDGEDFTSLFSHADEALYNAKEGGRNRFCVYEPDENEET